MVISPNSVVLRQNRNAKTLNREFELVKAIEKNKKRILDFNRQQMRSGKDSKDNFFTPYSTPYLTRKLKLSSYKAPSGIPDLYLSGKLQNNMDLIVEGSIVDTFSDVSYAGYVEHRYPFMFGLNPAHQAPARHFVTIDYNKNVHQHLNK